MQFARRWYGNFRVTDDLAVSPADYQRFTFVAPSDSRLPGGGGQTFTAFDLTQAANAIPARYHVTRALNVGAHTEVYTGISFGAKPAGERPDHAGRRGPGRVVTDDCDIVDDLPEMLHALAVSKPQLRVSTRRSSASSGQRLAAGVQGLRPTHPEIDVNVSMTSRTSRCSAGCQRQYMRHRHTGSCTAGNTTLAARSPAMLPSAPSTS